MKYSDVVDIPAPLEEVKQVRDSASVDVARVDVETYVISDRMAAQLAEVVLPNLVRTSSASIFPSPGSDFAADRVCRSRYRDAAFGLIAYTA